MLAERTTEGFTPDLIVEATMVCDLKCKGCYAPTISQAQAPAYPSRYLPADVLAQVITSLSAATGERNLGIIAVRGGEPTLHPCIQDILDVLRPYADTLYLETNGNWILSGNESLLRHCKLRDVIVKISFDSMHSVTARGLRNMCIALDDFSLRWVVAITEATAADFLATRQRCHWIPQEQIIVQHKVLQLDQLVRPRLGVVHPDGRLTATLSAKPAFRSAIRNHNGSPRDGLPTIAT
jgi:hypothetical protein